MKGKDKGKGKGKERKGRGKGGERICRTNVKLIPTCLVRLSYVY